MRESCSYDVEAARQLGLEVAGCLEALRGWCRYSRSHDRGQLDGHSWAYLSLKGLREALPYVRNERAAQRLLQSAVSAKYVQRADPQQRAALNEANGRSKWDQTNWFCFYDEERFLGPPIAGGSSSEESEPGLSHGADSAPCSEPIEDTACGILDQPESVPSMTPQAARYPMSVPMSESPSQASGGGDSVHVSSRAKSQNASPAAAAADDAKNPKPDTGTPCTAPPAAAASEEGVRTPAESGAFHDALLAFGCTEADALQISGLNRFLKADWAEAWNAEVVRRAGTSKPFRNPVGWLIRAAASGEWPSQAAQRAAERAAAVPVVEPHRAYQPAIVKDDPKIMARILEREAAHEARLRAQGLAL